MLLIDLSAVANSALKRLEISYEANVETFRDQQEDK